MSDEPINSPISVPTGQTVGTDSVNQIPEVQLLNPNRPVRYKKDGTIDRRAFTSARNGGAVGCGKPVEVLDPEKAIQAAALVITGSPLSTALNVTSLPSSAGYKIQKLIDLTPDEYFNRLSDRLENIIEKLTTRLEAETDKIGTRDLTLQVAILTDKLTNLRGQKAPTSVHNVQVNINGYSRESALAALTGRKPLVTVTPV